MNIQRFTFNEFHEETYILYDDNGSCVIVDPGCNNDYERRELSSFLNTEHLKPEFVLNTHGHLDHVFGNKWVKESFDVPLVIHKEDVPLLEAVPSIASMYGMRCAPSPAPDHFFEPGNNFVFGNIELEVLFTPGHSPGHVALFHRPSKSLISGDVLFRESIGRTDLPGGDYDQLITSIEQVLIPLGDDVTVYPGHGPATTIGHERKFNPFLN